MTEIEELIELAIASKKEAYVPYSHFRVACVVKTINDKIYKGVNVENASYSPTLCAERNALSTAITDGEREFKIIVICGDSEFTYPCGVCRQFIKEFASPHTMIVVAKSVKEYRVYSIDELLPHSFGKEDLK